MSIYLKMFKIAAVSLIAFSAAAAATATENAAGTLIRYTPASNVADTGDQTAVFAGGCFWGVEGVFEHVQGVRSAVSGYAGGTRETANYEDVSGGRTGHAESVRVVFDPKVVSYQQLLFIFFSVAHDPTQLNYQGPDRGTQYRSAIFYTSEDQRKQAQAFIAAIDKSGALSGKIATQIAPLRQFYEAEEYHQDYMKKNPDEPYIVINDLPKIEALKRKFPELYK